MHRLKELSFSADDGRDHRLLMECLSLLTGLRSLCLSGKSFSIVRSEIDEQQHLMTLTQLTRLSLTFYRIDRFRRFPMGIKSLGFWLCESPPANFAEILMTMTNLTSLSINIRTKKLRLMHSYTLTSSLFLPKLERLEHLSLHSALVDDAFLEALGMLTQLTSLILYSGNGYVDPYRVCSQLSNLTELLELAILCPTSIPIRMKELPQLCLPKLRKLNLPFRRTDTNVCKALWKTLPCLRQMSLSGKTVTFE